MAGAQGIEPWTYGFGGVGSSRIAPLFPTFSGDMYTFGWHLDGIYF